MKIFTTTIKKEAVFLRQPTLDFDFSRYSKKEIQGLVAAMKQTMEKAEGIGLSANQVGLSAKMFIACFQDKFYAVFNPQIVKTSTEKSQLEEGCLSVPDVFGVVERADKITLKGYDQNGRKLKIKAWGTLAQIFQHEVDHLNGVLFIDKAKKTHKVKSDKGYAF